MSGSTPSQSGRHGSIGKWIWLIQRKNRIYLDRRLHRFNLGSGQIRFLLALHGEKKINLEHLTEQLNVDKATTTRAIKKLESEGYVEREQDNRDHRISQIHLTTKGEELLPEIMNILKELTDALTTGLSQEDVEMVFDILKRMSENATRMTDPNGEKDHE